MIRRMACDPSKIEGMEIKIRFFTVRTFLLKEENLETYQLEIGDKDIEANEIIQEIYYGIKCHEQGNRGNIESRVPM